MTDVPNPLTFNQTVRGIVEFIEVAIHTILYVRHVYPPDLFVRRKKYDTPVFQSRHPALNEYISGAMKAIGEELALGNVDKVVLVINDNEQTALERFIFAVENMIEVENFNRDTNIEDAMTPTALGQYFRSFMIKLALVESQLGQMYLGENISFAIVLELKDNTCPSASTTTEPPPWIPAHGQHTTAGMTDEARLHMLRAVDTGVINLSLSVQESEVKIRKQRELYEPSASVSSSAKKPTPTDVAPTTETTSPKN
ncbi:DNA-binding protein [Fistulina hepatica ATCC 64428]|uniref:DNA-binding protein n=1 Tax=Fistulina hepatica ATCC 64428 TaxID=1128425 RepID=A0A0D7AHQ8_9AGAR|nr:DNA-binding protein [Fistulina hepatica ATCC 64428]